MSNSRGGWQPPGSSSIPAYSTPPARSSDSRQQFGPGSRPTPQSAAALGRSPGNGLAVSTSRLLPSGRSPWSARTPSSAALARGRGITSHAIGRRLSEAGSNNGVVGNYSPTTYGRAGTRQPVLADSLYQPGSASVLGARDGNGDWGGEQFPGLHYSDYGRTMGEMHTPHPEPRPSSRGSMHSATSTHTLMPQQVYVGSGKMPYLVRSVKIDAKVVPPQLDAIKMCRSGFKASRGSKLNQRTPAVRQQARVRVRMDISVNVLHPGEQCLDLVYVGLPQPTPSAPDSAYHGTSGGHNGRRIRWATANAVSDSQAVHIEHALYSVEPASEHYADSVASPLASPQTAGQSLRPVLATDRGGPDGTKPASLESNSGTGLADDLLARTAARKPDPRARQTPVFHAKAVSPYPPPPPTFAADSRPGASSLTAASALPGSDLQQLSRYESHTMASYSRAQARVSDRAAIYSDLGDSPLKQQQLLLARRTFSFNADSSMDPLAGATVQRPTSALGDLRTMQGLSTDNHLYLERPRSSMGLVRQRLRANSELASGFNDLTAFSSGGGFGARNQFSDGHRVHAPSTRAFSEHSSEFDAADQTPLCEFSTDCARGLFVARLYEPRRYYLTVWFSVPAESAMPASGEQDLACRGPAPDSLNISASASSDLPLQIPMLYPWESGRVSIRGLPRSLSTRIRIRLPHRQAIVDQPDAEACGKITLGIADSQPCLDSLVAQDGPSAPPATPKRQIMQVNIADIPSSIYVAKSNGSYMGSNLMASNMPSASDAFGTNRVHGCFYHVKMQQPRHIEPHSARTVSAYQASTRAFARATQQPFGSESPGSVLLGHGPSTAGEYAGWLNTDDSDAAENSARDITPPTTAYESNVDTEIQRFVDVYGQSDLMSQEQPHLVDSDGILRPIDYNAAASLGSDPCSPLYPTRSSLRQHVPAVDSIASTGRPNWAMFSEQQSKVDGIDYQKAEVTVFKLKSVDAISFSWAPRLVELCYPISPAKNRDAESLLMEQVKVDAGTIEPEPPAMPSAPFPRRPLETILSAESTPAHSGRQSGDHLSKFAEPLNGAASSALHANILPSASISDAVHVAIECVEFGIVLHARGLRIRSTVTLHLLSPGLDAVEAAVGHAEQLYRWPEFVDLSFVPLKYAVGDMGSEPRSASSIDLQHCSVTIGCAGQPERATEWTCSANAPSFGNQACPSVLRPSVLRVWISRSDKARQSSTLTICIESKPATCVVLSSMLLTERLLVALSKRLVGLAVNDSLDSSDADAASGKAAAPSLENHAGLWVTASVADSEDSEHALLLSQQTSLADDPHYIVVIERRSAKSASILEPVCDQQQRLLAAYAELNNHGAVSFPLTCLTAASIDIEVDNDKQEMSKLAVHATLKCSLATFTPWCMLLGGGRDDALLAPTPCLAVRVPVSGPGFSKWTISALELAGTADQSRGISLPQPTVVDPTLVVVPLVNLCRQVGVLRDEVTIDVVQCVLTTTVDLAQLQAALDAEDAHQEDSANYGLMLPLPAPLFSASDVATANEALAADDLQLGSVSVARLSTQLIDATTVSVTMHCPNADSKAAAASHPTLESVIVCPVDFPLDTDDNADRPTNLHCTHMVERRFRVSSCAPLSLSLVANRPKSRPVQTTGYVDTSGVEPPTMENNNGSVSGSCLGSCSAKDDAPPSVLGADILALSTRTSIDCDSIDSDYVMAVPVPEQADSAFDIETSSAGSICGGSLRNRRARARAEQSVDLSGVFHVAPAAESDPLITRGGPLEAASTIPASGQAVSSTRSGRAAKIALHAVIYVVVIGAVMLLAKERLFGSFVYSGWPPHVGDASAIPAGNAVGAHGPSSAVAVSLEDVAMSSQTNPVYVSVVSLSLNDGLSPATPLRFRIRAKSDSSDGGQAHEQLGSTVSLTTEAAQTAQVVMSSDGARKYSAPTDSAPLLHWLYKSVVGSVLELFGL